MLYANSTAEPVPDHVLRAMFVARKAVFIDLLKWDVPVVDGRFEVDQFDTDDACYLVLTSPEGAHLGSARLLPTLRPHILGTLYPYLCTDVPPSGEAVFEITRFCLDRSLRSMERRRVRDTLVHALAEHALVHGISHYTAIAEFAWFQQILAFGWSCMPLGVPQRVGSSLLTALRITIDPRTPALLAAAGIKADPTIMASDQRAAA